MTNESLLNELCILPVTNLTIEIVCELFYGFRICRSLYRYHTVRVHWLPDPNEMPKSLNLSYLQSDFTVVAENHSFVVWVFGSIATIGCFPSACLWIDFTCCLTYCLVLYSFPQMWHANFFFLPETTGILTGFSTILLIGLKHDYSRFKLSEKKFKFSRPFLIGWPEEVTTCVRISDAWILFWFEDVGPIIFNLSGVVE